MLAYASVQTSDNSSCLFASQGGMEAEGGTADVEVWVGGGKTEASNGPHSILSWVPQLYSLGVTEYLKYWNEESSVISKNCLKDQVPCFHLKQNVLHTQCFQLHVQVG